MTRKLVIGTLLAIIILVLLGIWLGLWVISRFGSDNGVGPSPYTAVYIASGDIYFGKFSRFPQPRLTEVWFLQRNVDQNNQAQFGILPFKDAFWGPMDTINLNSSQILFWSRLRSDSEVVRIIENPALQQQRAPGTFQGPPGQPPSGR